MSRPMAFVLWLVMMSFTHPCGAQPAAAPAAGANPLLAPWTAPHRLLLFVNVAEPVDGMRVTLTIDGKPVALTRAYTSAHPQAVGNTFVGWYADVSALEPEKPHAFEIELPPLAPGQFQGLFLDNVEAEYTEEPL